MLASDYVDGEELAIQTHQRVEYLVKVVRHTVLSCDLVVQWRGARPDLNHGDMSIICLKQLRSVRRG